MQTAERELDIDMLREVALGKLVSPERRRRAVVTPAKPFPGIGAEGLSGGEAASLLAALRAEVRRR